MASLKFDVGLVEDGKVKFMLGRGVSMKDAIEVQRVYNMAASFSKGLIAVVLQAGSHDAPDFTDEPDDSEAVQATEDAADAKSRGYKISDVAYDARAVAFKKAFREHWEHVGKSIDMIDDACCMGLIARSLKDLSLDLGDFEDAFNEGFHGSADDRELIAALGWDD